MEKVTTEDREVTITDVNGVENKAIVRIITTDHGVTDEDGNPKISVEIKVPSTTIGVTPGKNE